MTLVPLPPGAGGRSVDDGAGSVQRRGDRSRGQDPAEEVFTMVAVKDAAEQFLRARRIAVVGVSRNPQGHGGNAVLQGLRARGYDVIPVNPHADEIEGAVCYHTLADVPGPVDAVVVATRPDQAEPLVRECDRLGIRQVWLHRSIGGGSVSQTAVDYGREHDLRVIPGGCPLMFGKDADTGHKFLRVFCRMTGAVPRQV